MAWVRENISLEDLYEHTRKTWNQNYSLPPYLKGIHGDNPIELGRLTWPNSATRWATFYGIATAERVAEIVRKVYPPPPSQS